MLKVDPIFESKFHHKPHQSQALIPHVSMNLRQSQKKKKKKEIDETDFPFNFAFDGPKN